LAFFLLFLRNMELLLNLAWILLAVPAYWLWRRDAGARRVSGPQCLLALGCALVLLFPVISATDDLHAMRAEIEDAAISKRAVRQAGGEKASGWVNRVQGTPLIVASGSWLPALEVRPFQHCVVNVALISRPCVLHAGRAPPISLLG
jgi:hypothetical protein